MNGYFDVQVRPLDATASPVDVVARRFGWTFSAHSDLPGLIAETPAAWIDYFPDKAADDAAGMPFTTHQATLRPRDRRHRKDNERRMALDIFECLVASGAFSCFVVYDFVDLVAAHILPGG